ncbi:hypothetical protein V8G54_017289 [Vigna mungo]|uniref:Uncharacterized protein n=1 Tax=Vigna mungo TaxID=3915 RepID=A0AAQ3RYL4_VIGMU
MKERDVGSLTKMSAIYVATVVKIFCFLFSKFAAEISVHHSKMYFLTHKKINTRIPFSINKLTPRKQQHTTLKIMFVCINLTVFFTTDLFNLFVLRPAYFVTVES